MSFHGQVVIQCNSKVLDINMGTDALPIVRIWEGGRERPRFPASGYNHCFSLVVTELKFVYCHLGFDDISTLVQGEEEVWDLMRGRRVLQLTVLTLHTNHQTPSILQHKDCSKF